MPALSHLPAAERSLAARLFPAGADELPALSTPPCPPPLTADGAAAGRAAAAADGAADGAAAGRGGYSAGGVALRNGAGKSLAKLRRWSEAWGCGLALCRLNPNPNPSPNPNPNQVRPRALPAGRLAGGRSP